MSTDLNSGVSRVSGRVRKKSVKLIEMEELPPMEASSSGNNSTHNGTKKSPAPAKLKIVIGGKEVVRDVVPVKTSLFLNDSEKMKTLAPIKFRLNTSSVTHTLESTSPTVVKKAKVDNDKVKTIQLIPAPAAVVTTPVQPAKAKPVATTVNSIKKEPMTPAKLKTTVSATETPKNATKSKTVSKSVNAKNSTPKVIKEKRRHITAYTLWSRDNRSIIQQDHPELDFAGVSKRMGEVWQHLSNSEKYIWKMRAQKELETIGSVAPPTRTVTKAPAPIKPPRKAKAKKASKNVSKKTSTASSSPAASSCNPLRMAAHLKIIGESLESMGKQLSAQNDNHVSRSQLCSLLDCTLSSLGPLLALTTLDPRLDGCPRDIHHKILDNISYIMPNI